MKESNSMPEKQSPFKTATYWCDNQMRAGEWYAVKMEQTEVFKSLIDERYGWPVYVLNFNMSMDSIMKVNNGREEKKVTATV